MKIKFWHWLVVASAIQFMHNFYFFTFDVRVAFYINKTLKKFFYKKKIF